MFKSHALISSVQTNHDYLYALCLTLLLVLYSMHDIKQTLTETQMQCYYTYNVKLG